MFFFSPYLFQLTAGLPPELFDKGNRLSHSSDTSQAETMTSVTSSSLDSDEVDLSGLVESVVDSDEEDIAESIDVSNDHRRLVHCFSAVM